MGRVTFNNFGAFLFAALFAFSPIFVSAQVVISEIMYDLESGSDTDREWIEVFNSGASPVHLTDWKFFEANTNHSIAAYSGGEDLPSGGYAIIADNPAKFLIDWPAYSGLLFDSAFSLSNTGETLAMHTPAPDLATSDSVSYQSSWGASGDGNSLLRASASSSQFSAGSPAPGSGNLVAQTSTDTGTSTTTGTTTAQTTTTTNTSSSNTSAPTTSYVAPPEPQIFADAGEDRMAIVAADSVFTGRAYNRKKEIITGQIRFSWNFGDGRTAEGASVLHHFDYPGRYAVVLSIVDNMDSASDRVVVTAEPAKLSFTAFPDGSVAIQNLAGRDLDLSHWIIRSFGPSNSLWTGRQFILPKDSIILSGETLRIGDKTLGFRSGAETELDYPNGALALRTGESNQTAVPAAEEPPQIQASAVARNDGTSQLEPTSVPENYAEMQYSVAEPSQEKPEANSAAPEEEIPDEPAASTSQVAAAGSAFAEDSSDREAGSGSYLWWLGALGFALAGSGAVYAARHVRKRESFDDAHDKLLEGSKDKPLDGGHGESFDARDWKIIDDSDKK